MPTINAADLGTLGGRVEFLRVSKEWSGAELGRIAGFSQNTIWSLENNQIKDPSARLIWAVAAALETTPEFLWSGNYDPDEAALVAAFRALPPQERPAVLRAAGVSSEPPPESGLRKNH